MTGWSFYFSFGFTIKENYSSYWANIVEFVFFSRDIENLLKSKRI